MSPALAASGRESLTSPSTPFFLIHSPSPYTSIIITAIQVASRLWIVWGILVPVQGNCLTGSVRLGEVNGVVLELSLFTLMLAWCLSELIRYSFFALKVPEPGEGGGERGREGERAGAA